MNANPPSIQIFSDSTSKPSIYPDLGETYNFVLRNGNRVKYILKDSLGIGNYGKVYMLELKDKEPGAPDSLTIKFPLESGNLNDDITVLEKIRDKNNHHLIIDACHFKLKVNSEFVDFLLMEKMDGSLQDFIFNLNDSNPEQPILNISDKFAIDLNIIIHLAQAYDLLFKNGLIYTDSKIENILYRIQRPGQLEVFLSDYGGACPVGKPGAAATFPYIYDDVATDFIPHVADMIYGLYIIFLQIIVGDFWEDVDKLRYHNIDLAISEKKELIREIVKKINQDLEEKDNSRSKPIQEIILNLTDFVLKENMLRQNETQLWTTFLDLLVNFYQIITIDSEFAANHLVLNSFKS